MSIDVFPIGTAVTIGEDIPGTIQAVLIVPGAGGSLVARYDVEWWNGRDRKSDYFNDCQFRTSSARSLRIGFGS